MTAAVVVLTVLLVAVVVVSILVVRRERTGRTDSERRAGAAEAAHSDAEGRAAGAARRLEEAERRASQFEERAARQEELAVELQQRASEAEGRAERLESDLDTLRRQGRPTTQDDPALTALWTLDVLGRGRAARDDASRSTAATAPLDDGLPAALADEVARLREETGTPGELEVDLPTTPPATEAVVAIGAARALLAVLARHCQAYDLRVRRLDAATGTVGTGGRGDLELTVTCDGFDGPDHVADDAAAVLAALVPLGARLHLDAGTGRLVAGLVLPPPTPTPAPGAPPATPPAPEAVGLPGDAPPA